MSNLRWLSKDANLSVASLDGLKLSPFFLLFSYKMELSLLHFARPYNSISP
jgi:hypothetical protein